jgi:hypothetical protein
MMGYFSFKIPGEKDEVVVGVVPDFLARYVLAHEELPLAPVVSSSSSIFTTTVGITP